jgi:hypothetical protein
MYYARIIASNEMATVYEAKIQKNKNRNWRKNLACSANIMIPLDKKTSQICLWTSIGQ